MSGFSVQKYVKTKKKRSSPENQWVSTTNEYKVKKERYSPQISGIRVSHHDMVSPQNGDTWGGRPPSHATGLSCNGMLISTKNYV